MTHSWLHRLATQPELIAEHASHSALSWALSSSLPEPWRAPAVRQMLQRSGQAARRWLVRHATGPAVHTVVASVVTSWLNGRLPTADPAGPIG